MSVKFKEGGKIDYYTKIPWKPVLVIDNYMPSNEEYVYKLLVFMNSMYNIFANQWGSDSRWFSNHEKKNTMDHYLIG